MNKIISNHHNKDPTKNADAEDEFYNQIDFKQIAAVGVSLGGMTSTLVAFHKDIRDPRISAAA